MLTNMTETYELAALILQLIASNDPDDTCIADMVNSLGLDPDDPAIALAQRVFGQDHPELNALTFEGWAELYACAESLLRNDEVEFD